MFICNLLQVVEKSTRQIYNGAGQIPTTFIDRVLTNNSELKQHPDPVGFSDDDNTVVIVS